MNYLVTVEHIRSGTLYEEFVRADNCFTAAQAAIDLQTKPKKYMWQNPPYRIYSIDEV